MNSVFPQLHPDTTGTPSFIPEFVDVIHPDLSGIMRGKRLPVSQLARVTTGEICIPGSVFLLDVRGENHDPDGHGFSDGDPDCYVRPVGPLVPVPWAAHPTVQALVTFDTPDGTPYRFDPRNVLARALAPLTARGLVPVVAFELEFFLMALDRPPGQPPVPPALLGTTGNQLMALDDLDRVAGLLDAIRAACAVQGLPMDSMIAEYGPGQYEVNLRHIADPLTAADQCALLRRLIRGVVRAQGLDCTFMAKPLLDQPGSGMHVHLSLLDRDGAPAFDGADGQPSPLFRHALGGLLAAMPESMALFAPNRNAYRRFKPNRFVPVSRSWGHDNRSVALRVPVTRTGSWRFEHRVAGADANPHLVLAAILAGIEAGLAGNMDPGPAATGNAGAKLDPGLPFTLPTALDRLGRDGYLAPTFGDDYLRAYRAAKWAEFEKFESVIQPIEYDWYL
ncbi:glutamine synthetase family protein [Zavarzinia sp. CC-PAN008]|uniref:glutamine synthetase family protein n=1 Tax=Zavarzinia sp. CC-PAN008 TaxID=3243332 RepID=UPI003F743660